MNRLGEHWEWIKHDPDLDSLHGDPRWPVLLERFAGGRSPIQ
jgi:hypothetical protein